MLCRNRMIRGKHHPAGLKPKPGPLLWRFLLPLADSFCSHFETRMPVRVSFPTPANDSLYQPLVFDGQFRPAGVMMKKAHSIRKGYGCGNRRIYLEQVFGLSPGR